ncbi:helix-turn-helix transcriptional regulator [Acidithiobacillus albertensis]|uniref:helix-turn-helix transcriptional regulator n=1 Tax=Acidithiobacillus albertensis TaxID=119978 RepID=UPI001C076E95|nr:AlpA family phage regulatory protein [Acidithiobacillus albertensis]MBU2741280.1 AlpA family phage regulatory protein [Acidithiobacillus albertensis]
MKSEENIQPRALRAHGASTYCGVSKSTFLAKVKTGEAPAPRRIGKGVTFWLREDLDQWLDAAEVSQ